MSQVPQDWQERDFVEAVECGIRKCVDFLNNFHESAKYRLSVVDARLSTLERKLDFLDASMEHCDPGKRQAKPAPFVGSIFDPAIRRKLISQNEQMRLQNRRKFNNLVIAPRKEEKRKPIQKTQTPQQSQQRPQQRQQPQTAPKQQQQQRPAQQQPKPTAQPQPKPQSQPKPKPKPKPEPSPKVQHEPPAVPQNVQKPPPIPGAPGAGPGAKVEAKQQPPPIPKAQQPPANPVQQQPPPAPGPGAGGPPPNPVVQPQQKPPPNPMKPPAVPNVAVQKPPAVPGPPGAAGPGAAAVGGGGGPGAAAPPPPPGPGAPANPVKAQWPNKGDKIDILTVKEGAGAIPGGQSAVEIEYTGHLPGGKQFIKHREVIQLGKKMNIKGLEQAVTRIKVGSQIKLWIPAKLAYGKRGAGQLIPPDSDLVFNLMLHRIVKQ